MRKACLSCLQYVDESFSWRNLFTLRLFQVRTIAPLEEWLCVECRKELFLLKEAVVQCARCSRSLDEVEAAYRFDHEQQTICYDCWRWLQWEEDMGVAPLLASHDSVIEYNDWARDMLKRYKFQGDERLKYFFGSLLVEQWSFHPAAQKQIDMVMPIPISSGRLMERSFNQAAHLARLMAEHAELSYVDSLLYRTDDEQKQSKKNRSERLEEMLQKFLKKSAETADIQNKNILIVDDIYTTGATVYAAAYTLKKAGARNVYSYTVAR